MCTLLEKKCTKYLNPNFSGLPELHLFKHATYMHVYSTGSWTAFQNRLELYLFFILLFLKTILNLQKRSGEVMIPDPRLNCACLLRLFDDPTRVTELGLLLAPCV